MLFKECTIIVNNNFTMSDKKCDDNCKEVWEKIEKSIAQIRKLLSQSYSKIESQISKLSNELNQLSGKINRKIDYVYEITARKQIETATSKNFSKKVLISKVSCFMEYFGLIATEKLKNFLNDRQISMRLTNQENEFWQKINNTNSEIKRVIRKMSKNLPQPLQKSKNSKNLDISKDLSKFLKESDKMEINIAGRAFDKNEIITIKIGEVKFTLSRYNFTKFLCQTLKPLLSLKNFLTQQDVNITIKLVCIFYYCQAEDKELIDYHNYKLEFKNYTVIIKIYDVNQLDK